MKLKLVLATLALSLTTLTTPAMAGGADDAIKAAKSANKEAAAAGFAWTATGKMIKKAEALAKDGKEKKAIKIAKAAEMHSKAGLKQAALAKSAGPRF
ncbi:MAG: hypothetical protein L3J51_00775 [Cocleimonas sp.]|nr:hypothetical protein [Cocleimonas sp.]